MKPSTFVTHPPSVTVPDDNRALVAPIYQTVKFTFDNVEETERQAHGEREGFWYSRKTNPTLRQLELTLAGLQGREACLLTASGVAAVDLTMLALCRQGEHVIFFAEMYKPTQYMIRRVLGRYGVRHTLLSIDDVDEIERTLASTPTRLVVFESPSNPVLKVADISRIAALARKHGALTLLDNTLAGVHNHGQFDVDVFVHSLTKYVSGHGDVLGGAVIANQAIIDALRTEMAIFGASLDPHAAFLMQRGLKTYFLRYERQCQNAMTLANYLESRSEVSALRYPGLKSHPQHELACAQQHDFGSMIAFDLQGGPEAARKFAEALSLFSISASLGSTESLVLAPQLLQPRDFDAQQTAWSAITESTVRLSVGVEDIQDLIGDIEQALAASGTHTS
ncbi:trans-sulfuration enzyme family protein [Streptomyces spongiae]|uniref:homocysteine desulfhydrase n=1 Tax=Streptomyces spongiae TaxID=565072 RepID=A0A5N8X8U1_9ACTN|nr:aminotransferase class I/II-fold pyridoxal phosphate-dependent enzyme [Streptomyces spongiae]MPY55842.1 aminotransferase class I/II-fold pyridoxal phosphate-dependent enzyme [Streptomyces spongiae]